MRVPTRGTGAEQPVVAKKPAKAGGAKGLRHPATAVGQPRRREEPGVEAKPFCISKRVVWEAFKKVKANNGAAGVDSETIEAFEADLAGNLYKLWNRMSSGTYFPPPVRTVLIPKKSGGERRLGIPTVADRVAQMVAKMYLEPLVEPQFHPDSYGYRPKKSAIDALGTARQRCWRYAWVVDLDIKGFLVLLRAVPLRPVKTQQDGNGDPTTGRPGDRDPQGQDHPAMAEGEGNVTPLARVPAVVGSQSVVVHPATPDMRSAPLAEGVIGENEEHLAGDASNELVKQETSQFIGHPSSPAEETVEGGEVLAEPHRDTHTQALADRVLVPTQQPPDGDAQEVPERGLGESRCEDR